MHNNNPLLHTPIIRGVSFTGHILQVTSTSHCSIDWWQAETVSPSSKIIIFHSDEAYMGGMMTCTLTCGMWPVKTTCHYINKLCLELRKCLDNPRDKPANVSLGSRGNPKNKDFIDVHVYKVNVVNIGLLFIQIMKVGPFWSNSFILE